MKHIKKLFITAFLIPWSIVLFSQTMNGVVNDAQSKLPISNVSIKSGNSIIGQTDEKGNFTIKASNNLKEISFSHTGYSTKIVKFIIQSGLTIELEPTTENLQDIVVVGYGTTRRKDITGSVVSLSEKEFVKGTFSTPEQLIQGRVAGVQVSTNGGAPGAGSTIRIRGGASLNASNDPLIVIDGILISNDNISGQANPLSLINPADIENFTILKDASATAIFGSRASNGVIIITTKKGTAGKIKFNFNNQIALQTPYRLADIYNGNEIRSIVNTNNPSYAQYLGTANTNWQKEIFQNAPQNQFNFSASGNITKNFPFRASISNNYQDGILRTGNLNRSTFNLNLSPKLLNNHLLIDFNVLGSYSLTRFANEGAIGTAVRFNPTQPVYSNSPRYNGYWEWLDPTATNGLKGLAPRNPVGLLESRNDNSNVSRIISNLKIDYKFHFLPDLKISLNLGADIANSDGNIVVDDSAASDYRRYTRVTPALGGTREMYKQERQNTYLNLLLNYNKNIKDVLTIDATAGFEYQDYLTTNYSYPRKTYSGAIDSNSLPPFPFDKPQYAIESYLARVNLDFLNKYVLTATIRQDASSKFASNYRALLTPSIAFAYNLHNEDFFKNSNYALSLFKFRLSWGITGNQDGIGYYDYISFYNKSNATAQYLLGNTFYSLYRPNGYYPNRTWEKTETYNAGIDLGFLNNRFVVNLDYYERNTTDLLNRINQPALTNFSNRIVANVGSMKVKGLELNLFINPVSTNDLDWNFSVNAAYNANEITKLTISPDPNFEGVRYGNISGGVGNTILIQSEGFRRGSFYVFKQVYDPSGKPIDNLFEDLNRDGVINEKDLYRYQGIDPYWILGFANNLRLWKFTLGVNIRANLGNYVYNNVASSTGTLRNIIDPLGYIANGSRSYTKSGFSGSGDRYYFSDYFVENASFLRVDNISLAYNIGQVGKISNISVNANIQNAFLLTKYSGVDPEISGGIDNNLYPRPRTFVVGVNLNF